MQTVRTSVPCIFSDLSDSKIAIYRSTRITFLARVTGAASLSESKMVAIDLYSHECHVMMTAVLPASCGMNLNRMHEGWCAHSETAIENT